MRVPSKERLATLLKRAKVFDISNEENSLKIKKALQRVVDEKDRDPKDLDPYLENFLQGKQEEEWASRVVFFMGLLGDNGEIIGGIYGRAYDEKKRPFVAHYLPFKAKYLQELCESIGFLDGEIEVPVLHKNYYELVAFNLGETLSGERVRHEDLFFTIGGLDTSLILKNMPTNVELSLGSVPVVTSKGNKIQEVVAKAFLLELFHEEISIIGKEGILTFEDFADKQLIGKVEGAYLAKNGIDSLDFGKLISELSKLTSIDWNLLVRYMEFMDNRLAPVDDWSEEGNWEILGLRIPWLVNHLSRDLWELNVVSKIGGVLLEDR